MRGKRKFLGIMAAIVCCIFVFCYLFEIVFYGIARQKQPLSNCEFSSREDLSQCWAKSLQRDDLAVLDLPEDDPHPKSEDYLFHPSVSNLRQIGPAAIPFMIPYIKSPLKSPTFSISNRFFNFLCSKYTLDEMTQRSESFCYKHLSDMGMFERKTLERSWTALEMIIDDAVVFDERKHLIQLLRISMKSLLQKEKGDHLPYALLKKLPNNADLGININIDVSYKEFSRLFANEELFLKKLQINSNYNKDDQIKLLQTNRCEKCKLFSARLLEQNLAEAHLQSVDFCLANLDYAVFKNADLKGAYMNWATLFRANLQGADLRNAKLNRAYLRAANLRNANLEKTQILGATLFEANLNGAKLKKADLRNVNLRDANLENADFTEANMENADLSRANLKNANFTGTNLKNADFTGVNLKNANLTGAIF